MAAARPVPSAPPPRGNPLLLGHEAAEADLRTWIGDGRLGHALLIAGPWGIGKATWAYRIARTVLRQAGPGRGEAGRGEAGQGGGGRLSLFGTADEGATGGPGEAPTDDPVDETFRWIASGAHPDLLTVERRFDEKRGRMVSEIVVDDVRRIGAFLGSSPARGGWRVVIVDAADEMNRNAANALLKVLEEPGTNSLLLLVAHRPALLPATVRSRCRRVRLRRLEDATLGTLIERWLPGTDATEAASLCMLAEGSIGRALQLAACGGLRVHRALGEAFEGLAAGSPLPLLGLATDPAIAADEDGFQVTGHVLSWWLRRIARSRAFAARPTAPADHPADALPGELATIRRVAAVASLDRWGKVWEKTQRLAVQAAAGNLDRRQTMTAILLEMQRELRSTGS